jgi:hypothetical protein
MALHFEAQRNFMCEVCGASFHAKGTLESHIAFKHTDSRLFKYDQCGASFKVNNTCKGICWFIPKRNLTSAGEGLDLND